MTNAEKLKNRWLNDLTPCDIVADWAREIDPRVLVYDYLYTARCRMVFSDGSVALVENNKLTLPATK